MQEDVASALLEAANLLLVGMGVVFAFLTLLIGAVNLIAWLNRKFPEPQVNQPHVRPVSNTGVKSHQHVSPKIVAAISAAVRQYRRTH